MSTQRFYVEVVRASGKYEKCNNGNVGLGSFQMMIQPCQCLDEYVGTLVAKFVTASSEKV